MREREKEREEEGGEGLLRERESQREEEDKGCKEGMEIRKENQQ